MTQKELRKFCECLGEITRALDVIRRNLFDLQTTLLDHSEEKATGVTCDHSSQEPVDDKRNLDRAQALSPASHNDRLQKFSDRGSLLEPNDQTIIGEQFVEFCRKNTAGILKEAVQFQDWIRTHSARLSTVHLQEVVIDRNAYGNRLFFLASSAVSGITVPYWMVENRGQYFLLPAPQGTSSFCGFGDNVLFGFSITNPDGSTVSPRSLVKVVPGELRAESGGGWHLDKDGEIEIAHQESVSHYEQSAAFQACDEAGGPQPSPAPQQTEATPQTPSFGKVPAAITADTVQKAVGDCFVEFCQAGLIGTDAQANMQSFENGLRSTLADSSVSVVDAQVGWLVRTKSGVFLVPQVLNKDQFAVIAPEYFTEGESGITPQSMEGLKPAVPNYDPQKQEVRPGDPGHLHKTFTGQTTEQQYASPSALSPSPSPAWATRHDAKPLVRETSVRDTIGRVFTHFCQAQTSYLSHEEFGGDLKRYVPGVVVERVWRKRVGTGEALRFHLLRPRNDDLPSWLVRDGRDEYLVPAVVGETLQDLRSFGGRGGAPLSALEALTPSVLRRTTTPEGAVCWEIQEQGQIELKGSETSLSAQPQAGSTTPSYAGQPDSEPPDTEPTGARGPVQQVKKWVVHVLRLFSSRRPRE